MKRLISADDIYLAEKNGLEIVIDKDTIITDYAMELAEELGVEITHNCNNSCLEDSSGEPALSCEEIYKIAKMGLESGAITEEELEKLLQ